MKTGRNDPCPCGSGKKYKHCCLGKDTSPLQTLDYRRFSRAFEKVMPLLIEHGISIFGKRAPELALAEFLAWPEPDEQLDEEALDRSDVLFWPWFVLNWEYDRNEDEDEVLDGPEGKTVAELFLAAGKVDPQSIEGRLIQGINRVQYSFKEILSVDPGRSVTVRDLLTGAETTVQEQTASKTLKPEDILFGRTVTVEGVGMFLGVNPYVLPLDVKPQIIQLRRFVSGSTGRVTADPLYELDLEIRNAFWKMDRALHGRPQMQNTDGHPLEFHRLVYEIASAELAVEALAPLCHTETLKQIRTAATKDKEGRIVKALLDWNRPGKGARKAMGATVRGHIEIDGRRMTVSVNSAMRAATIKTEIERRLKTGARLRADEIRDTEAMLKQYAADDVLERPDDKFLNHPEVQRQIVEMLGVHWKAWVDERLPILDGRTPRQAARTPDGRESVEALLRQSEKMAADDPLRSVIEPAMIADVRRRLGLDRGPGGGGVEAKSMVLAKRGAPHDPSKSEVLENIRARLKAFGDQRLNETYTGFTLALCDAAADCEELNLQRGRTEIWAAAVVYAIARLNFLFSPETPNHLTVEELCRWFDVKKTTAGNKADMIRSALELFHSDERFCTPHITRIFQFVEDEQGFIHPAADLSARGDKPPALKAPRECKAPETSQCRIKPEAPPAKPANEKPETGDDRQLPLFKD